MDEHNRAFAAGWTLTPDGRWWREIEDGETHDADRVAPFLGSGPFVWADSATDALAYDAGAEDRAAAYRQTVEIVALGSGVRARLPVELTPIGEQYVIPGCERDPDRGPEQGSLWP